MKKMKEVLLKIIKGIKTIFGLLFSRIIYFFKTLPKKLKEFPNDFRYKFNKKQRIIAIIDILLFIAIIILIIVLIVNGIKKNKPGTAPDYTEVQTESVYDFTGDELEVDDKFAVIDASAIDDEANFFIYTAENGIKVPVIVAHAQDGTLRVGINRCRHDRVEEMGYFAPGLGVLICQKTGYVIAIGEIGLADVLCTPIPLSRCREADGKIYIPVLELEKATQYFSDMN